MNMVSSRLLRPGVWEICLRRPDKKNAFDLPMARQITRAFDEAAGNPQARVVLLRGAGAYFCTGGDIGWMEQVLAASASVQRESAAAIVNMMHAVHRLPQPLVAYVHGAAMGGGVGLACCADVVVAEADAVFRLSEGRLGIIPAAISPYLVAVLGLRAALELTLHGQSFDSQRAQALGLVTEVVAADSAEERMDGLLDALLKTAPGAQRHAKALFRNVVQAHSTEMLLQLTTDALACSWQQEEARHGLRAFLAKEPVPWLLA